MRIGSDTELLGLGDSVSGKIFYGLLFLSISVSGPVFLLNWKNFKKIYNEKVIINAALMHTYVKKLKHQAEALLSNYA